jgi:hypothetical protein
MKGNMHKENPKIEKDRSYDDELIIVKHGKGYLNDDDLSELGMTREEYDALGEEDGENDSPPEKSLAERMGSENVAPGYVFETPQKKKMMCRKRAVILLKIYPIKSKKFLKKCRLNYDGYLERWETVAAESEQPCC